MRDVFYDVFVMFILRFFAVFKLLQLTEGYVVIEVPIMIADNALRSLCSKEDS